MMINVMVTIRRSITIMMKMTLTVTVMIRRLFARESFLYHAVVGLKPYESFNRPV